MSCGQNDRVGKKFFLAVSAKGFDALDDFLSSGIFYYEINGSGFKMKFAAQLQNFLAHVVYDLGQLVGSDMGMRVGQNFWVGSKVNEGLQNLADVSALVASSVKLSVAKSACPAFAKTVIAVRVHDSLCAYGRDVALSLAGGPAALDYYGLDAALQKFKGRKKPCGAASDDDDFF